MIWVVINRFAVWSHLNEELRGERVLWHRPWVPVRSRVRYTELGTVILGGGGGPHQINSQIHRAGDSYTGEGESPHQIYNQVYRAGNSYTGGWVGVWQLYLGGDRWLKSLSYWRVDWWVSWVYLWFGEVNRELEIITSFQNNNRTKKADKFHRKLMTSVRTFVE